MKLMLPLTLLTFLFAIGACSNMGSKKQQMEEDTSSSQPQEQESQEEQTY